MYANGGSGKGQGRKEETRKKVKPEAEKYRNAKRVKQ